MNFEDDEFGFGSKKNQGKEFITTLIYIYIYIYISIFNRGES